MQQNNSKQSNQSEIEFNFIEIVRILLNSKRLIILTTIAIGTIGWLYSSYFNPALPPNIESTSVVEIGSYTAPDNMLIKSRHGRILIASMEASVSRLNAEFGMHKSLDGGGFTYITDFDKNIHRIRIYEIDSQYFKIEVVGAKLEVVKNQTHEIIKYVKTLHNGFLDNVRSRNKRELKLMEETLLTIDKFINYISENEIYVSNVAELKLKEIEYKYQLAELNRFIKNIETYKDTDLIGESVYKTNYPESNTTKLTLSSLIIGFILVSFVVLIRHALAKNHKE
jgi:hypothetical protein